MAILMSYQEIRNDSGCCFGEFIKNILVCWRKKHLKLHIIMKNLDRIIHIECIRRSYIYYFGVHAWKCVWLFIFYKIQLCEKRAHYNMLGTWHLIWGMRGRSWSKSKKRTKIYLPGRTWSSKVNYLFPPFSCFESYTRVTLPLAHSREKCISIEFRTAFVDILLLIIIKNNIFDKCFYFWRDV